MPEPTTARRNAALPRREPSSYTPRISRVARDRQVRTELAQIDRELKQIRAQLAALEGRRSVLLSELAE